MFPFYIPIDYIRFMHSTTSSVLLLEAIDDLLPYDDTGRPMGISSGQIGVAWPALIEKAVCHHHVDMAQ